MENADRDDDVVNLSRDAAGFHCRNNGGDTAPVRIHLDKYLSSRPHCLSGRVLEASLTSDDKCLLACKIYSPEVQRIREDAVLGVADAIATAKDPEMCKHLPKLHSSGDIRAGDTLRVRSILGIPDSGHRTLRIVVTSRLEPLTSLPDAVSILKAWFDIVIVHAFLWANGVEHGDPSLWNAMIDPESKRGVLNDYDLSVIAWLHRVPGTDRTGTIPFMALELLKDDYWSGKIQRYYHHELEALVWVLIAISIGWKEGTFNPTGTIIQHWFTSDHDVCCEKKLNFIFAASSENIISSVHHHFDPYKWLIDDLRTLMGFYIGETRQTDRAKSKSLQKASQSQSDNRPVETFDNSEAPIRRSGDAWDRFGSCISESGVFHDTNIVDIAKLNERKPNFIFAQDSVLFGAIRPIIKQFFPLNVGSL